jgi:hypothetical protein
VWIGLSLRTRGRTDKSRGPTAWFTRIEASHLQTTREVSGKMGR